MWTVTRLPPDPRRCLAGLASYAKICDFSWFKSSASSLRTLPGHERIAAWGRGYKEIIKTLARAVKK